MSPHTEDLFDKILITIFSVMAVGAILGMMYLIGTYKQEHQIVEEYVGSGAQCSSHHDIYTCFRNGKTVYCIIGSGSDVQCVSNYPGE